MKHIYAILQLALEKSCIRIICKDDWEDYENVITSITESLGCSTVVCDTLPKIAESFSSTERCAYVYPNTKSVQDLRIWAGKSGAAIEFDGGIDTVVLMDVEHGVPVLKAVVLTEELRV